MIAETFLIVTIMFICVLGPCLTIAVLGYAVIKALGRNPSSASKILSALWILLVFVEAISRAGILVCFQLFTNKGLH